MSPESKWTAERSSLFCKGLEESYLVAFWWLQVVDESPNVRDGGADVDCESIDHLFRPFRIAVDEDRGAA